MAGLGAAFILVPVYLALGVSMHSAQVKTSIGGLLFFIAATMAWKLLT